VGRLAIASFNATNRPFYGAGLTIANMFVFYVPIVYVCSIMFGLNGLFGGMALANILGGLVAAYVVVRARQPVVESGVKI
ncbi:MAG: hypothetical protein J7M12_04660, partial [Candidatus Hydrogenedentes bacterium]|nr:hypothetical protein [Candidatus Hydrogenedentota bacterium]